MKFDDVRTVQFWPPFVLRAHPPYARFARVIKNGKEMFSFVSYSVSETTFIITA